MPLPKALSAKLSKLSSLSLVLYVADDSPMLVHHYLCQIFHVDAHGKGVNP
jgi:hypothetical protein